MPLTHEQQVDMVQRILVLKRLYFTQKARNILVDFLGGKVAVKLAAPIHKLRELAHEAREHRRFDVVVKMTKIMDECGLGAAWADEVLAAMQIQEASWWVGLHEVWENMGAARDLAPYVQIQAPKYLPVFEDVLRSVLIDTFCVVDVPLI